VLSLDSAFAPAAITRADLYRELGRDAEGGSLLPSALQHSPNDASMLHALGLLMVRLKQNAKALGLLATAARLDPANARYANEHTVALKDAGRMNIAIDVLEACIKVQAHDRDSLVANRGELVGDHAEVRCSVLSGARPSGC
jgi:Flp pilus assembly protein TadD